MTKYKLNIYQFFMIYILFWSVLITFNLKQNITYFKWFLIFNTIGILKILHVYKDLIVILITISVWTFRCSFIALKCYKKIKKNHLNYCMFDTSTQSLKPILQQNVECQHTVIYTIIKLVNN